MQGLEDDQSAQRAERKRRRLRTALVAAGTVLVLAAAMFAHLSGIVGPG